MAKSKPGSRDLSIEKPPPIRTNPGTLPLAAAGDITPLPSKTKVPPPSKVNKVGP